MKKLLSFFPVFLVASLTLSSAAQQPPLLTLVNSMVSFDATEIVLHLDGNVDINYWNKDYLKIEMDVESSNLTREQLRSLVKLGYLNVKTIGSANGVAVCMPTEVIPITVNGVKPVYRLSFRLFVPLASNVRSFNDLRDALWAL